MSTPVLQPVDVAPGEPVPVLGYWLEEYYRLNEARRNLDDDLRAIRANILTLMGEAEAVSCNGYTAQRRTVQRETLIKDAVKALLTDEQYERCVRRSEYVQLKVTKEDA